MKRKICFGLLLIVFLSALVFCSRDLFRFRQEYIYKRGFLPEQDPKGDYVLTRKALGLKAGAYRITVRNTAGGVGSGVFLRDAAGEMILSADLRPEQDPLILDFTLSAPAQVAFGVAYDPISSAVDLEGIVFSSDRVLTRESLLRHAVIYFCLVLLFGLLTLRIFAPDRLFRLLPCFREPANETALIILILLTLIVSIPFFVPGKYTDADDVYFHLRNIRGIADTLRAGYFPPRITLGWLENYGYGSGFYYPGLFLLIPAGLLLLGFDVLAAYKIFVILCTFCALLTMYIAVLRITDGSRFSASAAVIFYAFAAYRLVDTYYRAALGEIQAFVFLPLIILGIFEIFNGRPERWPLFALGFFGLLSSHMISLALTGFVTAVFMLLNLIRILRDRKILFALIKSVVLVLCAGAWFLLPMIEQSMTNELKINTIINGNGEVYGSSSPFSSLFLFFDDWSYDVSTRFVYPGWPILLLPVVRLFLIKNRSAARRIGDICLLYGIAAAILCTGLFPWDKFLFLLSKFQFAWRFMMIASALLSVSAGIYIGMLCERVSPAVLLTVVSVFCLVSGGAVLLESVRNHLTEVEYYIYVYDSNFLSGSEYKPINLTREFAEKNRDTVLPDPDTVLIPNRSRRGLTFTFDYEIPDGTESADFVVPMVYFTGYRAELSDPDGNSHPIPVGKNWQGLVQVSASEPQGRIRVAYCRTTVQWISDGISLLTLVLCAFEYFRRRKITSASGTGSSR